MKPIRHSGLSLLVAAGLLVGCGDGVDGLGADSSPLVTLEVELASDTFQAYLDSAREQGETPRLRVSILWAGVPNIDPYCIKYGPSSLEPNRTIGEVAEVACVDPFQVVPALVAGSAPAELDGVTELPLFNLPSAEVVVGPPNQRIAYGSIVVYDDVDDDGVLDLRAAGNEFGDRDLKSPSPDRILAASFSNLLDRQTRLVFREGDYNPQSFFYPMIGCEAPPRGFSWAVVTGTPIAARCTYNDISESITLRAGDPEDYKAMLCRPGDSSWRLPRREAPDEELQECVSTDELVVTEPEDACPRIRHFNLAGCSGNPDCEPPDWDFTDDPPAWWPCNDPDEPLLEEPDTEEGP